MARIQTASQVSSQSPLNSLKRSRFTGHLHYNRVSLCCSIKPVSVLRFPLPTPRWQASLSQRYPCFLIRCVIFFISSPSVTPTPEQKAVWDSLLNRVGKIRSLSKKRESLGLLSGLDRIKNYLYTL